MACCPLPPPPPPPPVSRRSESGGRVVTPPGSKGLYCATAHGTPMRLRKSKHGVVGSALIVFKLALVLGRRWRLEQLKAAPCVPRALDANVEGIHVDVRHNRMRTAAAHGTAPSSSTTATRACCKKMSEISSLIV